MVATISALPTVPSRAERPATFSPEADAFWGAMPQFRTELNQLAADLVAFTSGLDFNGTSTTSTTIGTGSKTFTTQAGKLWQVGQFVIVAYTTTPANYMYGQVTAYAGTSLTVNVTAVGGSGTQALWSIGAASVGGVTPSSADTLQNKTFNLANNTLSTTLALLNAAVSDADVAAVGHAHAISDVSGLQTALDGKAATGHSHTSFANLGLTDPQITGTILEDIYSITDGAAFEINPRNGSIQMITLGASRTPKATTMVNGESVTLAVDDGTAYTLTWTDATFGGAGVKWLGGSAPALATTGYTWITLWKVGGQVYGSSPGSSA